MPAPSTRAAERARMLLLTRLPGAADETTGHDARLFIERFLDRFPRLRDAPLWLSGESFGVRAHRVRACSGLQVVRSCFGSQDKVCNPGRRAAVRRGLWAQGRAWELALSALERRALCSCMPDAVHESSCEFGRVALTLGASVAGVCSKCRSVRQRQTQPMREVQHQPCAAQKSLVASVRLLYVVKNFITELLLVGDPGPLRAAAGADDSGGQRQAGR